VKYVVGLALRLGAALLLLLLPLNLFYLLLGPPTLYGAFWTLSSFSPRLEDPFLLIGYHKLKFIPACVATSAYYLLSLLVLLTKGLTWKKGAQLWVGGTLLVFLGNLVRIDLLIWVLVRFGVDWFATLHLFFWHVVSTVYVAGIWIGLTRTLKVRGIPAWSDLQALWTMTQKRRSVRRKGR